MSDSAGPWSRLSVSAGPLFVSFAISFCDGQARDAPNDAGDESGCYVAIRFWVAGPRGLGWSLVTEQWLSGPGRWAWRVGTRRPGVAARRPFPDGRGQPSAVTLAPAATSTPSAPRRTCPRGVLRPHGLARTARPRIDTPSGREAPDDQQSATALREHAAGIRPRIGFPARGDRGQRLAPRIGHLHPEAEGLRFRPPMRKPSDVARNPARGRDRAVQRWRRVRLRWR